VRKALGPLPGVAANSVKPNVSEQSVTLIVDKEKFDPQEARRALAEVGFPNSEVTSGL